MIFNCRHRHTHTHTMFVRRLLRPDLRRPLASLVSARGVKSDKPSKTEIVDTELGSLHLSVDDDEDIFSTKSMDFNQPADPPQPSATKKEFGQPNIHEELNPYGSNRRGEGGKERSVNTVTLLGRVGNDPLMRGSRDRPVTVFSLATSTTWKSQGAGGEEWSERTDWHNIAVFKPGLRDTAYNYISKGSRVYVTGKIMYGEVTDRAGIRRHTTTIAADDLIFMK